MEGAVNDVKVLLKGLNPLHIENIWQMLYRSGVYRGDPVLMNLIAGIDQALWDIKGKYYKVPVYEMLGGAVQDYIDVYSWIKC